MFLLLQSLARLKEEFMFSKNGGSSPDVSTLSLSHEKASTESQTDLIGDVSNRLRLYSQQSSVPWKNTCLMDVGMFNHCTTLSICHRLLCVICFSN